MDSELVGTIVIGLVLLGLVAAVVFVMRRGGPTRTTAGDGAQGKAHAEAQGWEARLGNTLDV